MTIQQSTPTAHSKERLTSLFSIIAYLICLCNITSACNQFEYLPYSVDIDGRHNINTQTITQLETADLTLPLKFAFITDTQGAWDETEQALKLIKQRGDIRFIIHGGDLTDFGLPKEYIWTRDMLEKCGIPYFAVIGNHDCLGNGEETFNYIFGPQNFSLNVANTHIVGLNTVALEYDYSKPVPDFNFIENDRKRVDQINDANPDSLTHTIVVMHSRPFDEQFNNNVANPFNDYIAKYPGMAADSKTLDESDVAHPLCTKGICINGHNHSNNIADLYDNGILYYQCPNMSKRCFFVFTITQEGFEYEVVEF